LKLKILFHDNCFDGAASAAIFSRFYREKIDPTAERAFLGVQHKTGDPFGHGAFDGDVNACVDFRYASSPRLTWWFDHHVSAFLSAEDRAHFEADESGRKFYDPAARSCTGFQARMLAERFGFDTTPLAELIEWGEIIDGAQFPDAKTAVELREPALQLMTWIENNKEPALTWRYIEELERRPLAEIARQEYITRALEPVLERHHRSIDVIRDRASERSGVVSFDLTDTDIDAHNKFISYMLYPECRYVVGITRGASRVKVSVGSNPWPKVPHTHDIASLCERYGGGGHPVVGAISLPPDQRERAQGIAREIVEILSLD
jgi:hypothetical protein